MIWNIQIELPDELGNQVLRNIAQRHNIELSETPTESEINQVSQAVASEVYEKEKLNIAQKAANEAFDAVMNV